MRFFIDLPELGKGNPEVFLLKSATPSYGLYTRHVKNLEINNVRVGYHIEDKRSVIACIDVDGFEIDNFKAKLAFGTKASIIQSVRNLVVNNPPFLDEMKDDSNKNK